MKAWLGVVMVCLQFMQMFSVQVINLKYYLVFFLKRSIHGKYCQIWFWKDRKSLKSPLKFLPITDVWYRRYTSCLRLIIHFLGKRKWFSEVKSHFFCPPRNELSDENETYINTSIVQKFELFSKKRLKEAIYSATNCTSNETLGIFLTFPSQFHRNFQFSYLLTISMFLFNR